MKSLLQVDFGKYIIPKETNNLVQIGEYQFDRNKVLGKGTFGTVFLGNKIDSGEKVAVKTIIFQKSHQQITIQREVQIQMELKNHPNIVELFEVYQSNSQIFLVMEYCESTLKNELEIKGFLLLKEIQSLYKQLIEGFKILKEKQIVHRDIKVENILIKRSKKGDIYKIADFGLSKELTPHLLNNTRCGTPIYVAPEVLKKEADLRKCDLWSLGIMLYYLIFNESPTKEKELNKIHEMLEAYEEISLPKKNPKEAVDLIANLLKSKAAQRISWEKFFTHPFFSVDYSYEDSLLEIPRKIFIIQKQKHEESLNKMKRTYRKQKYEDNEKIQKLEMLNKNYLKKIEKQKQKYQDLLKKNAENNSGKLVLNASCTLCNIQPKDAISLKLNCGHIFHAKCLFENIQKKTAYRLTTSNASLFKCPSLKCKKPFSNSDYFSLFGSTLTQILTLHQEKANIKHFSFPRRCKCINCTRFGECYCLYYCTCTTLCISCMKDNIDKSFTELCTHKKPFSFYYFAILKAYFQPSHPNYRKIEEILNKKFKKCLWCGIKVMNAKRACPFCLSKKSFNKILDF